MIFIVKIIIIKEKRYLISINVIKNKTIVWLIKCDVNE